MDDGFTALKEFKYRLEINGLNAAVITEAHIGKRSISVVERAGAGQNHATKEPGGMKYANLVLKTVVPDSGPGGLFFYNWMNMCQDAQSGYGQPISACYQNLTLYEMDNTGVDQRITEVWEAFVVDDGTANKVSLAFDKDVIDEIEIAYNYYVKR